MAVVLHPPLSKSDAIRAVFIDSIGDRSLPLLTNEVLPDDVLVTQRGLQQLREGGSNIEIDCHDGGAPFRFLLAHACLCEGKTVRFTGTQRLAERPVAALIDSLKAALGPQGVKISFTPGQWPCVVETPRELTTAPTEFAVCGEETSQFSSGLALAAAMVARRWKTPCAVRWLTPMASRAYFDLTLKWLRSAGFPIEMHDAHVVIHPGAAQLLPLIPGDWSSLTYLLLFGWKFGVPVGGIDWASDHPDSRFVEVLRSVGITLTESAVERGQVEVRGKPTRGFDVDISLCPDSAPALGALATVLPGPSVLRHIEILRKKESDRAAGVERLVRAVGGQSELVGDTLTLYAPSAPHDIVMDDESDHRMAMSTACAAALNGVHFSINHPQCVSKSFPTFWREAAKVGVQPQ